MTVSHFLVHQSCRRSSSRTPVPSLTVTGSPCLPRPGSESQHQESGAGEAGKGSPAKTGAWVPKVKQQQHQQSDDRRSSTAVASAIHDLGSDLIEAAGSESAGKGKNRSKNKKMNWKPLAVPIIRRDPHDRDRDIRGSTRKYGFSGMGGRISWWKENGQNGDERIPEQCCCWGIRWIRGIVRIVSNEEQHGHEQQHDVQSEQLQ